MKIQKQSSILLMAKLLIKKKKVTTVKSIKEHLIKSNPDIYWTSQFIHDSMMEFEDCFTYSDIEGHRLFRNKRKDRNKATVVYATNTELAKLITSSKGRFLTLVHKKVTTSETNKMNCQYVGMNDLGLFLVKEKKQLKTIYPNTLKEVKINNTIYKLK